MRRGQAERPGDGTFVFQQPLFAVQSASVAGEFAICPDDAVTGDYQGDRVLTVGEADGAGGGGASDSFGQVAVGVGLTGGNGSQGFPNELLEGRARELDGHSIQGRQVATEVSTDASA